MPTYIALIYGEDADWMDEAHRDQMAEYGEFGQAAEKVIVGGHALQATSTVAAPCRRAAASAALTNGVTPLAETPTTTSPRRTRPRTARRAAA